MIDIEKQRAECARLQAIFGKGHNHGRHIGACYYCGLFAEHFNTSPNCPHHGPDKVRTGLTALIKAHREALDEIERLRAAGKFLAQGVPPFERRMHDAYEAACRVFEEVE